MRVASISSSRADVGPLSAVWRALADSRHELHIILTGMHMAPNAPQPGPLPASANVLRCGADLGGKADAAASRAMGAIAAECGALYAALQPDVVVVLGDRLDMAPAALAATLFNIPLVHLHGGEITEGAVDDRIRHAVTMLADLHLVSSRSAADRVARMGANPDRIVITGAPGLDTLLAAPDLSRAEFLQETGLARVAGSDHGFVLATVHPETNAADPAAPMRAVLAALDAVRLPVLFTAPNSDPGGHALKRMLNDWSASRDNVVSLDTLGSRLYPNALRHAALMVGNSSSGIIEAGLFGLPVVDVGDRQKGRERGGNVFHAPSVAENVLSMLRLVLTTIKRANPSSPYGDGASGPRVAAALSERLPRLATAPTLFVKPTA